jgi:assimilatory nitrate reductase catalytic subunit
LIRDESGTLVPTSWQAALDFVAERIRTIQEKHGKDSVAVFGGGGLTNEKAYQLGKFARIALGTANIDYNGRFCMSSAAAAANRSLGLDRGLPFPVTDFDEADVIMLIGSNSAETMPPLVGHFAHAKNTGGLIVLDPRVTATAALVGEFGEHIQPVPGTDLAVLLGISHVIAFEGLLDRDYIAERTQGFEQYLSALSAWWPERTEAVTGVPAEQIRSVARTLAANSPKQGGRTFIITGRGIEQSRQGTDGVTAAINLALMLGLVGAVGSGYGTLTGQGNGQGGREHGQKADQLPGYRMITDPQAREHVARVWGVEPQDLPDKGKPAVELLKELGQPHGPQALLVHGSNIVVSAPRSIDIAERLRSLKLLVICDFILNETSQYADVVLPVLQWAEEDGTMTNLEGRVLRRRAATTPPEQARSELWVMRELAHRLRAPGVWSTDPAEVFDELAAASRGGKADYSGLSHESLDRHEAQTGGQPGSGLYWPIPATSQAGTPRVFTHTFPTPSGRATFHPVQHRGNADPITRDHSIYLVTGRVLEQYQSGAQTRRVKALTDAVPEAYVEMHPLLAQRYDLEEGQSITLKNDRGTVAAAVRITRNIRPDTVFMPFHWGHENSVNRVINWVTDPISGMPEFKTAAVLIETSRTTAVSAP